MSIEILSYTQACEPAWEEFSSRAVNSTLLHTRAFLSYHGDRFEDRSLIVAEDGKWVGLFPAAVDPTDASCVVSHPGATYGGVLHRGNLQGERMIMALEETCRYYAAQGYARLVYKAVPAFYHQSPAEDDLYALFRLGAARTRCDLSSTIDLHHRLPVSERRRRSLKKAIKAGVEIVEGLQHLAPLWEVLTNNLARKHGTKPVHTLAEITLLAERFPNNVHCICGGLSGSIEAGVVLFVTQTANHAQYIASSDHGYEVSALDLIFENCIDTAIQEGKRWFDFGISSEDQGKFLNEGLYRFKSEFGGGGVVHEFFELNLQGLGRGA